MSDPGVDADPALAVLGPDICVSGGADGADLQWGLCSGLAGFSVLHWSFKGHRCRAPAAEIVLLSETQLAAADAACQRANETLKRRYPPASRYVQNLLRRDYYQVAWSGALYAITALDHDHMPGGDHRPDGSNQSDWWVQGAPVQGAPVQGALVDGGTAWATQMFIDQHQGAACAAYVFCQRVGHWFVWQGAPGWQPIDIPPRPQGIFAGIGSRGLELTGKLAIRTLLDVWPKPPMAPAGFDI